MVLSICRWRDVKMRAFDNAKHRTYVDLKVMSLFGYLYKISLLQYYFEVAYISCCLRFMAV